MTALQEVIGWCMTFLYSAGYIVGWLTSPVQFGFINCSPLALISFAGLTLYLGVAITKWFLH